YGWPTAAAGSTQVPLTSVPPLVPGEHSKVIGRAWANAGVAAAMAASSAPAAATAAAIFLIMSSSRVRVAVAGRGTRGGGDLGGGYRPDAHRCPHAASPAAPLGLPRQSSGGRTPGPPPTPARRGHTRLCSFRPRPILQAGKDLRRSPPE